MSGFVGADLLALTSAAGLLLLAVGLARVGRQPATLFLAAFAALWGAQAISVHVALQLGVAGEGHAWLLASEALLVPLYLPLAHFVALYPRRARIVDHPAWPLLISAPALAALALILLVPRAGLDVGAAGLFGWATLLLLVLPLFASQVAAFARFALASLRTASPSEEQRMRLAAMAFLAFLSYDVAYLIQGAGPAVQARLTPAGTAVFFATVGFGGLVVAVGAIALIARARGSARWALVALVLVPPASALLSPPPETDLVGLWRLLHLALLAYAVARYQLLGLDLRLRRALQPLAAVAIALATWGILANVALAVAGVGFPERAPEFLALGLVAALVGLASRPFVGRFADREFPSIRATEEYQARRRLEVYRAASEAGAGNEQRERLAQRLGLEAAQRAAVDARQDLEARGAFPVRGAFLAGRYGIVARLAEGAHGPLLLAEDRRLREQVVLKCYAGLGAAGFAREAKVLGDLQHANVIAIRDVVREDGNLYVAMEHADGGSLESRLQERGALPEAEALRVMGEVLAGLAAAHKRGIVHRDVKPSNILFRRGVAKIADFGVAKDPVFEDALRTLDAQPGTLAWMSPEQARGERVTAASDVYAAGAVLYAMLAGQPYIDVRGLSERDVRSRVVRREPRLPLPGIGPRANAVVARAIAKDPARRYANAAAMLRDVQRAARDARAPQPATPTAAVPSLASPAREDVARSPFADATMDVDDLSG